MIVKTQRIIRPIQIINKNNKKCPSCNKPMIWMEGLLVNRRPDTSYGKYVCTDCNLFCKTQDSRAIMKGRKMAKKYKNNPNFKWEDIGHLPVAIQLGILREIQT